ncbi:MAG TPA: sigma-54 dependent transcriptional regulator, partial [Vicinamibacterales bacterium]|nr:sigma-54 dependent transcriptional regulator [Vicinamibacterales bacterium]
MTSSPPGNALTVLLVDDEADIRDLMRERLELDGFAVDEAAGAVEANAKLEQHAYDALVVDLRLPDGDGADVLRAALQRYPQIMAVVMTGFGGVPEAVAAMKRGVVDFLVKPFSPATLADTLQAEIDRRRPRQENADLRFQLQTRARIDDVVGQSGAMQQVLRLIERVAPMNAPVLIQGETGTGKELVARAIHARSRRAEQRFVAFNAAAIPESLVEAELFGHARGAFTGAVNARVGRFELADRGTIFIDELALMSMPLQAKLLRVLQEKEV